MTLVIRIAEAVLLLALGYALGHLAAEPPEPVPLSRTATLESRVAGAPIHEPLLQALLETEPLARAGQTAQVLQTTTPDKLDSVLATVARIAVAPGDVETALLAEWLTAADPRVALEWANTEDFASHPWVFGAVARSWARRDAEQAAEALGEFSARMTESAGLVSLVIGWDEGGHPGLEQYLLGIEQGQLPQQAIEALVRRKLLRDGPEATMRWAESLPDDRPDVLSRFKRNAMRRTASALVDWDPQLAMDWAASFGESRYGRGAYRRVAFKVALQEPERAMAWLRGLPEGPQRDSAVTETWRTFMIHDRENAMAWIRVQPDEPWLDPAFELFAQRLAMTEGAEQGLAFAGKIDDPRKREKAVRGIGAAWHRRDPEAARAWAQNPPAWMDEELVLMIADPPAYQERQRELRQQARARYEARRAARLAREAASEADPPDAEDSDE